MVAHASLWCLQACQRHKTAPTASAALGRALVGTLLLGSFKEEGEKTQVTFKGDGILGSMQVKHDALSRIYSADHAKGILLICVC